MEGNAASAVLFRQPRVFAQTCPPDSAGSDFFYFLFFLAGTFSIQKKKTNLNKRHYNNVKIFQKIVFILFISLLFCLFNILCFVYFV